MREAREPLDRIKSRIPGMSASLYPRRDVFGQAMTQQEVLGFDLVSPLYSGRDNIDPTIKTLINTGLRSRSRNAITKPVANRLSGRLRSTIACNKFLAA